MQKKLLLLTTAMSMCAPIGVLADAPVLKSGTPVIYLADNLDEKDQLGWCIDTKGRGFAENLQAHSCKPDRGQASDTQFSYHEASGQIRSVPFEGKCMTLNEGGSGDWPFTLVDCLEGNLAQQFSYDAKTKEIQLASDQSQCVVVADKSNSAGPFMSRELRSASCLSTEDRYKQWVVKD